MGKIDPFLGSEALFPVLWDNKAKAGVVEGRKNAVAKLWGPKAVHDVTERLPERLHPLWLRPVTSQWVPMKDAVDIDVVIVDHFLQSSPEAFLAVTNAAAEADLNLVYRFILRMKDPAFVLKRIGVAFSTKIQRGRIEVKEVGVKQMSIELHDVVMPLYACGHTMAGWAAKAALLTGAARCDIPKLQCRHKGDPICSWRATWE